MPTVPITTTMKQYYLSLDLVWFRFNVPRASYRTGDEERVADDFRHCVRVGVPKKVLRAAFTAASVATEDLVDCEFPLAYLDMEATLVAQIETPAVVLQWCADELAYIGPTLRTETDEISAPEMASSRVRGLVHHGDTATVLQLLDEMSQPPPSGTRLKRVLGWKQFDTVLIDRVVVVDGRVCLSINPLHESEEGLLSISADKDGVEYWEKMDACDVYPRVFLQPIDESVREIALPPPPAKSTQSTSPQPDHPRWLSMPSDALPVSEWDAAVWRPSNTLTPIDESGRTLIQRTSRYPVMIGAPKDDRRVLCWMAESVALQLQNALSHWQQLEFTTLSVGFRFENAWSGDPTRHSPSIRAILPLDNVPDAGGAVDRIHRIRKISIAGDKGGVLVTASADRERNGTIQEDLVIIPVRIPDSWL